MRAGFPKRRAGVAMNDKRHTDMCKSVCVSASNIKADFDSAQPDSFITKNISVGDPIRKTENTILPTAFL